MWPKPKVWSNSIFMLRRTNETSHRIYQNFVRCLISHNILCRLFIYFQRGEYLFPNWAVVFVWILQSFLIQPFQIQNIGMHRSRFHFLNYRNLDSVKGWFYLFYDAKEPCSLFDFKIFTVQLFGFTCYFLASRASRESSM